KRLVICPTDLAHEDLPTVIAQASVDAVVSDDAAKLDALGVRPHVHCAPRIAATVRRPADRRQTEWVMFTSGTTGAPKMVMHTLAGLTAAIKRNAVHDQPIVWGTFYDIRRYGGLQIFFRALIDGGSFVLSNAKEAPRDYLVRL